MPEQTKVLSYLLKATALLIFAFMIWRLWLFIPTFTYVYNLYAALASAVVGLGVLSFDIIYKPRGKFVNWVLLLGIGILSLAIGIYFVFFAGVGVPNPLILPTVAVGLLGIGIIIIVESFLIWGNCVPGSHELNRYTLAPVLIKITAFTTIIWGVYNLTCVIRVFDYYGVPYELQWERFLLGIGCIIIGSSLVLYQEYQKRQPHLIMRRLPLALSFFMLIITLFLVDIYVTTPTSLMFPISLALGITLLIESFYLVNYPTKIR